MKHCKGTTVNGAIEGWGVAAFAEGHTYEGEFRNGVMHGRGRFTWRDGLTYEGEFKNNHLSGQGTYTWPDGSTYTGDIKDGIREGYGTFHSPAAGVKYAGQWYNGKRHGKGKLIYDDPVGESYYDGDWLDDQQTGWGQRHYKSGNTYKGQWLENRCHGQGTMYWRKQQEQYTGEWCNGVQHGQGEHVWFMSITDKSQYPLQNSYIGEWKNGMRDGLGTFHYASGAIYMGQWCCNQKDGKGKYVFQNGQVYEGLFTKDRMAAEGKELTRPLTPLGNLLGDRGTSCTEQFNINISPLIPPSCDAAHELRQLHACFVRHITQLRRAYHKYSSLVEPLRKCKGNMSKHVMTRIQLWQLLKDCKLCHIGMSLCDADNIIDSNHDPTTPFLMREFLQALVFLAYHLFHEREDCQSPSAGLLAQCFSHFVSTHMILNAEATRGLYFTGNMSEWIEPYLLQCWDVFCHLSLTNKGFVTLRALLLLLKDCGLVGEYLTSETAVHILLEDNPLAGDRDSCNLDIKAVFLEFMEFLLHCSKSWYTSKQQTQYTATPSVAEEVQNNHKEQVLTTTGIEDNISGPAENLTSDNSPVTEPTVAAAAAAAEQPILGYEASAIPETIPDHCADKDGGAANGMESLAESLYKWEDILQSFFMHLLPAANAEPYKDS